MKRFGVASPDFVLAAVLAVDSRRGCRAEPKELACQITLRVLDGARIHYQSYGKVTKR